MTAEPQGVEPEGVEVTNPAATGVSGAPSPPDGSLADGTPPSQASDDAGSPGTSQDTDVADPPVTVESLVESLEQVTSERDGYFDSLLRLQAEFENYKKAVSKREADARSRANEGLVTELLPVLDACDGAVANGAEDVTPIRNALSLALVKHGVERLEPTDAPFDPEQHEAVMHEESSDGTGPHVAEVLRVGYQLNGRTVRAAMVRVRG